MYRKQAVVSIAALLVLCLVSPVNARGDAAGRARVALEVREDGLYDAAGRLVNLRGVNVANNCKSPPFLPFEPGEGHWWDQLREWGFNLVRFLVVWEAIEPGKGVYDEAYLDKVEALIDEAAERGIYVFVDMHQDMFGRSLKGDGAPGWAVTEAGVDPADNNGFGGQFWGLSYILSTDLRKCFTAFWTSRGKADGLQEHYRGAFVKLAGRLADNPYVLGYDMHNEPSSGNIDNYAGDFENNHLKPFYEDLIRAIREVDPDAIGFVEPNVLDMYWSRLTPFSPGLGRMVYAPHMYDNITEMLGFLVYDDFYLLKAVHAMQKGKAGELGMPLLVGEFGAPSHIQPAGARDTVVDNMYRVLEGGFTSSTLWNYTVRGADGYSIIDGSGNPAGIESAVRPYARKLAGTPVSQSFDRTSRTYTLEFTGGSPANPTVIHVPASVQYPRGFRASVSDGSYSFRKSTGELVYRCGRRAGPHRLVITPAP